MASVEDEDKVKELLMEFQEPERSAVKNLSAASNAEDLALMVKLWQAGIKYTSIYFLRAFSL